MLGGQMRRRNRLRCCLPGRLEGQDVEIGGWVHRQVRPVLLWGSGIEIFDMVWRGLDADSFEGGFGL